MIFVALDFFSWFQDINSDVAAMIRDSFIISQQIIKDKTCLQCTFTAADTHDVAVFELVTQKVDDFLQRIYFFGFLHIILNE